MDQVESSAPDMARRQFNNAPDMTFEGGSALKRSASMPSVAAIQRTPSLTNIRITALRRNPSKDRKSKKKAAEIDLPDLENHLMEISRDGRTESVDDRELGVIMVKSAFFSGVFRSVQKKKKTDSLSFPHFANEEKDGFDGHGPC